MNVADENISSLFMVFSYPLAVAKPGVSDRLCADGEMLLR